MKKLTLIALTSLALAPVLITASGAHDAPRRVPTSGFVLDATAKAIVAPNFIYDAKAPELRGSGFIVAKTVLADE